MQVTIKTTYRAETNHLWKKGDIWEIKAIHTLVCCPDMEKALDDKFIGFGEYDTMLNRNSDVNIYHCSPWPEGAVWGEMPIKICPFCGEVVEVIESEVMPTE